MRCVLLLLLVSYTSATFHVIFNNGGCSSDVDPCDTCGNGRCDGGEEVENCPDDCRTEVVQTSLGPVRGLWHVVDDSAPSFPVRGYMGIPYGNAPSNFEDPVARDPWTDTFEADSFGPGCPQLPVCGAFAGCPETTEEDCLNLNIFAPLSAEDEQLPVFVWFHAGGWQTGGSAVDIFNPLLWINRDRVIVVTINHREGIFGGLCWPDGNLSGNYRIKDEILAVEFIKENIAAFGGNPDRITLSGTSSGAYDAAVLGLSPLAPEVYGVVPISGPFGVAPNSNSQANYVATVMLEALGCDPSGDAATAIACARGKTITEILAAEATVFTTDGLGSAVGFEALYPWVPCVDATETLNDLCSGATCDVDGLLIPFRTWTNIPSNYPVRAENWLISNVEDEGTANVASLFTSAIPEANYGATFAAVFGSDLSAAYPPITPPNGDDDTRPGLGAFVHDVFFLCPRVTFADDLALTTANVFVMNNHHTIGYDGNRLENVPDIDILCEDTICHSEDSWLLFGSRPFFEDYSQFTSADEQVARLLQRAVAAQVRSGNPSISGLPTWNAYTGNGGDELILDTTPTIDTPSRQCGVANAVLDQTLAATDPEYAP